MPSLREDDKSKKRKNDVAEMSVESSAALTQDQDADDVGALEQGVNDMSVQDATIDGASDDDDVEIDDDEAVDEDEVENMEGVQVQLDLKVYVEEQCEAEGKRLREILAAAGDPNSVLVMKAKNFSVINSSVNRNDFATPSGEGDDENAVGDGGAGGDGGDEQAAGLETIAEGDEDEEEED